MLAYWCVSFSFLLCIVFFYVLFYIVLICYLLYFEILYMGIFISFVMWSIWSDFYILSMLERCVWDYEC